MAKDDVKQPQGVDIAGEAPVTPVPTRITSQEDAVNFVKSSGLQIPAGCDTIFVTEDRNIFWKQDENAARNHAERQHLKLFTLNEWTK